MERELIRIRKQINFLKLYAATLTIAFIGLWLWTSQKNLSSPQEVIRVKGIVVEDDSGRERILIGAPVPFARNRIRTDTNRVKQLWGKYFPPEYMNYYKSYSHETNGIIFLDSTGFDRIIVGDPTPDPNIGKRIGPSTGITINDGQGFERTGYGMLDIDGQNRVVLGLDNDNGTEGLALAIFEDGTSGFIMNGQEKSIFIGKADTSNWYTGDHHPFNGLLINDKKGKEIMLNAALK